VTTKQTTRTEKRVAKAERRRAAYSLAMKRHVRQMHSMVRKWVGAKKGN
jgi:hypothetical protein